MFAIKALSKTATVMGGRVTYYHPVTFRQKKNSVSNYLVYFKLGLMNAPIK